MDHCKSFDHKNYGDWKLQGPCRENLHYLWKRAVRIAGKPCNCMETPQLLQPFSIDSADYPCRDPAISNLWSKHLQCRILACLRLEKKSNTVYTSLEMFYCVHIHRLHLVVEIPKWSQSSVSRLYWNNIVDGLFPTLHKYGILLPKLF